jgi:hypothetical protein
MKDEFCDGDDDIDMMLSQLDRRCPRVVVTPCVNSSSSQSLPNWSTILMISVSMRRSRRSVSRKVDDDACLGSFCDGFGASGPLRRRRTII